MVSQVAKSNFRSLAPTMIYSHLGLSTKTSSFDRFAILSLISLRCLHTRVMALSPSFRRESTGKLLRPRPCRIWRSSCLPIRIQLRLASSWKMVVEGFFLIWYEYHVNFVIVSIKLTSYIAVLWWCSWLPCWSVNIARLRYLKVE